ncbi:hypothetical protein JDV02_005030 [Purpureocillium takamizusanense]|uniref:Uncharacterized protein n=1 Tax=Purpureocillium takamizusanense TaxID=2060973 RepID=A0A9Q8QFR6_9HYPO|nr:uncharacterized protein JDV02_005030 [Purpureocillium takamizusanense]UNI18778.1 hypothetical protein JDV02_005030 [Purpureocillium takamizusanense]
MNFSQTYDELIIKDVWGTPGQNGEGVWKKRVREDEFEVLQDPEFGEVKMFFSLEEFVLSAQWVMKDWRRPLRDTLGNKISACQ